MISPWDFLHASQHLVLWEWRLALHVVEASLILWFNCWIKEVGGGNKTTTTLIIFFLTFKISILLVCAGVIRVLHALWELSDIALSSSLPVSWPRKVKNPVQGICEFLGAEELGGYVFSWPPVPPRFLQLWTWSLCFYHIDYGMKPRAFLSSLTEDITAGLWWVESWAGSHITLSSQTSSISLAPLSLFPSASYPFLSGFLKLLQIFTPPQSLGAY